MPISVKDKAVIVTGGAGEMGSSIARRLVDEGAKVVIADVADGSALADELSRNGDAVYVKTDVTSEESTEAWRGPPSRPTVASTRWSTTPDCSPPNPGTN